MADLYSFNINKYILGLLLILSFASCKNLKKVAEASPTQKSVIVLNPPFEMMGLDRSRQIRIYLPINYSLSDKKYPVLYMHDGQNLFEDSTSYVGEWGVDESLDSLSVSKKLDFIVVGIDNGQGKRINELSPWENEKYGKAEGEAYMEFIVKQIKPYIDSTYRTLSNRENTAIMGSSLGGLISHYAIYKYPEIFGKAGIFSPSYWYADEVYTFTKTKPVPKDARLFLVMGKEEGDAVKDAQKMYDLILASGHPKSKVNLFIDPSGGHNEKSWRRQFAPVVEWLFAE